MASVFLKCKISKMGKLYVVLEYKDMGSITLINRQTLGLHKSSLSVAGPLEWRSGRAKPGLCQAGEKDHP